MDKRSLYSLLLTATILAATTTAITNPITLTIRQTHGVQTTARDPITSPPQIQWSKTYGGKNDDVAFSVQQTADGGYIVAGHTESFGTSSDSFWLVKTDQAGNMQWNRTYEGRSGGGAYSVRQTTDGGYVMAGRIESLSPGPGDFWLVKTDSAGNQQLNRTYGGNGTSEAHSVWQTSDGGYAIAGWTASSGAGFFDIWLVKTDSAGNMQWNRTYGGSGFDYANSVQQTTDGGYIMAGHTDGFNGSGAGFCLVKTDLAGDLQWTRTYGGTPIGEARSVQQTADGGYIAAGYTIPTGASEPDFFLVKTDSTGTLQWNKIYGGTGTNYANAVQQTSDGGYIMAGATNSFGAGGFDFWLVKTDSVGTQQWNETFGGKADDIANSVQQTSDGGYIIAGSTYSYGAGGSDFWLVKIGGIGISSLETLTIIVTIAAVLIVIAAAVITKKRKHPS